MATAIYTGYFVPRAVDFLAFLAVGPALLAAGCIPFLNHVPHTQHSEAAHDSLGLTSSESHPAALSAFRQLLHIEHIYLGWNWCLADTYDDDAHYLPCMVSGAELQGSCNLTMPDKVQRLAYTLLPANSPVSMQADALG